MLFLMVVFNNPEVVKKISCNGVSVDLYSTQEEANTRILLHLLYADDKMFSNRAIGRIVLLYNHLILMC